jgi:hypothetical protein
MNIVKIKSAEVAAAARNCTDGKTDDLFLVNHDKKFVCIADNGFVDEAICAERGYEVYKMHRNGGTFVLSEGDIGAFGVGRVGNTFLKDFVTHMIAKLRERGLNAYWENNDVLVDGYKVCGISASITRNSKQFFVFHVAININLDDIKAICTKPMVKVPKGLSEYGVTAEEVEKWFVDYCAVTEER